MSEENKMSTSPDSPRCASCGKHSEKLYPTYWMPELVCSGCVLHSDEFPEYCWENRPTPPQVLAAILESPTIEAVRAAFRLIEPAQGSLFPEPKPVQSQTSSIYDEEVA